MASQIDFVDNVAVQNTAQEEYEVRVSKWQKRLQQLQREDLQIAISRGITFGAGIVILFLDISNWWVTIPLVVFAVLAILHEVVIRGQKRTNRALAFYQRALDRLEDRWVGRGNSGERFVQKSHPYCNDLDIFGRGSLYELLCLAQTSGGEKILADWLLQQAEIPIIMRRQEAIKELTSRSDFREDLALTGREVGPDFHADEILRWASMPTVRFPVSLPLLLAIGALSFSALIGWLFYEMSSVPFLALFLVEIYILRISRESIRYVTLGAEHAQKELRVLSEILSRIEQEPFSSELLASLKNALQVEGGMPSQQISRLARLLELLESSSNQFFAPLAIVLLWNPILTLEVERWRSKCSSKIPAWIETVGQIEALSSFAWFSFEHAADVYPEISADAPLFSAEGLGHPLIPVNRCVRNDVRLDSDLRLLIVSGSNMSGKSTLLRSIGLNAVMALAGAPVRATGLTLSKLAVGASIRVIDSLQDGTSRFYEEIKRLKQLADLAATSPPLLFLLDEILHGTNSVDRSIGAEALVRSFLTRGAIGLITTHDLALTNMATKFAGKAENVHFEDHAENGKISFDYRLRPGVVAKSNAIALMRAIGLDV